ARGMMQVLRALVAITERHGLSIDSLMPVNGVDSGTMRTRLMSDGMMGAVAAKTGTQPNVDGGVATLAGVAYTRGGSPLLFVIFNSHGDVHYYRTWEDALLTEVARASGGPRMIGRLSNTVPDGIDDHMLIVLGRLQVE